LSCALSRTFAIFANLKKTNALTYGKFGKLLLANLIFITSDSDVYSELRAKKLMTKEFKRFLLFSIKFGLKITPIDFANFHYLPQVFCYEYLSIELLGLFF